MNREFIRFALAGGVAAAVNILSRWLLSSFIRFEIAVVIAYLIGMAVAFGLTRHFVFARSDRQLQSEAMRFVLVNLFALAQVWIVSVGLAEWVLPWLGIVWQKDLIAHVVGVVSPIATSYFGHKKFTFR
ncbi:GtrA family protein [Rhodopseudomonas sp. P2A-2r]|uniref:GtrA family protein n=1 Tax=Rhodopseudomonas sp. P2A-2r TaxID=2991972 RepID=UPI002234A5A1|nr:GtrA family protein [Rhodopseudomonas sp. P2A-2r]UZE48124.1 GtrA family protein [Rhodopseudomonas sp. P2A-2r]